MAWVPGVTGTEFCLSEEEWKGWPAFKTLVTAAMILGKNTPGDTRIVDVVTEPPPGANPYNVRAYLLTTIIKGYESNFLPNVNSMISSPKKVEIRTIDRFDYMWEVLGQSDLFKELLSSEEWKVIDREHSELYGKGLNAIKYFIHRGFEPFWNPSKTVTGLFLRTTAGLCVAIVHNPVCWIGYAGPLEKREGVPNHAALINQMVRAEDAHTISLLSRIFQQKDAADLVTSKDLGDFPIHQNILIGSGLRAYVKVCTHGNRYLATFFMKCILIINLHLLRLHRMGYKNKNCQIVARPLFVVVRVLDY